MKPQTIAFRGPTTWDARKGSVWQNRSCSSAVGPRDIGAHCGAGAQWMIARSPDQVRGVRWACDEHLKEKYADLPRRLFFAPEEDA